MRWTLINKTKVENSEKKEKEKRKTKAKANEQKERKKSVKGKRNKRELTQAGKQASKQNKGTTRIIKSNYNNINNNKTDSLSL